MPVSLVRFFAIYITFILHCYENRYSPDEMHLVTIDSLV